MPDRNQSVQRIKQQYTEFEQRLKQAGKPLVHRTAKGIYATTNMVNIFGFFKEINLQNYDHFLDLGCGDGRVVLIASLFTRATGIEYTEELIEIANTIKQNLNLKADFIREDYLHSDLTKYDIIFINPDHDFKELDEKLHEELKGPLFVYNEIFAPSLLKKGKKFWYGSIPIIKFTRD
jgi:SAM-dependent methyltransferase